MIYSIDFETRSLANLPDVGLDNYANDYSTEVLCIAFGTTPETVNVLTPHNPSPRLFTDLLRTGKDDLNIFVISIQPKTTTLGAPLSKEVLQGLETLADAFSEALHA